MEKKTIDQWCDEYDAKIFSYDGFRDKNPDDLLTRDEFLHGMMTCTIQFGDKLIKAFDEKRDEYVKKHQNSKKLQQ